MVQDLEIISLTNTSDMDQRMPAGGAKISWLIDAFAFSQPKIEFFMEVHAVLAEVDFMPIVVLRYADFRDILPQSFSDYDGSFFGSIF